MEVSSRLLAEYALEVRYDDLPDAAVEEAKRFTLDVLGCALGAHDVSAIEALRDAYGRAPPGDGPGATAFGTGNEVAVEYAALLNAAMGRYFDFNDVYDGGTSVCHPSGHVPALIAVADAAGRSGRDLVEAIVLTYEIQPRLVDSGAMWSNGFDYVTWGGHAAAAAVGKLMGLSAEEIANAIGMVATSSNGLLIARQGDVSMWKGVAEPFAIHNAVHACRLAREGLTGPGEVYAGPGGVFEAIAGGPIEVDGFGGRDGEPYKVLESSIKPFACAYVTQSAMTAARDLVEEHDIDPSSIESIHVRTFERAMHSATPEKWSTDLNHETADHSMPYTVALAILDGEVTPESFREERLRDPQVHDLMATVSVEEDDDLTERGRANPGYSPSHVTIETPSGTYERLVDYPLGHPENPMTDEQLEAKARGLIGDRLSEKGIDRLFEACYSLDEFDELDGLTDALTL